VVTMRFRIPARGSRVNGQSLAGCPSHFRVAPRQGLKPAPSPCCHAPAGWLHQVHREQCSVQSEDRCGFHRGVGLGRSSARRSSSPESFRSRHAPAPDLTRTLALRATHRRVTEGLRTKVGPSTSTTTIARSTSSQTTTPMLCGWSRRRHPLGGRAHSRHLSQSQILLVNSVGYLGPDRPRQERR
jgi:hypothetical protein